MAETALSLPSLSAEFMGVGEGGSKGETNIKFVTFTLS